MTNFTHNLKIILTDKSENIIKDNNILDKIKNKIIEKSYIYSYLWNNSHIECSIKWEKKNLNKINEEFMGDLFSYPIYDYDTIIYEHTNKMIKEIKKELKIEYEIKFYISRLLCDKKIIKEYYDNI
jgi:hypothetical protein